MGVPYFNDLAWNDLTREERFYCFVLYQNARNDPRDFARWLSKATQIDFDTEGEWDLGVEVCLYRDYSWHRDERIRGSGFSPKRTFDLCLFGPKDIIIIEAKVFEQFGSEQNSSFLKDSSRILALFKPAEVKVSLVALASSKYLESLHKHEHSKALRPFHGCISWARTYQKFGDSLLLQADELYGSDIRKLS